MIELGPHTLHFHNSDGQSEAFEVAIFLHPPKEEGTPDYEDGLAYYGEVLLTFAQHERRMKVSCENNIELVGGPDEVCRSIYIEDMRSSKLDGLSEYSG
jgi:hypothetical protein